MCHITTFRLMTSHIYNGILTDYSRAEKCLSPGDLTAIVRSQHNVSLVFVGTLT